MGAPAVSARRFRRSVAPGLVAHQEQQQQQKEANAGAWFFQAPQPSVHVWTQLKAGDLKAGETVYQDGERPKTLENTLRIA